MPEWPLSDTRHLGLHMTSTVSSQQGVADDAKHIDQDWMTNCRMSKSMLEYICHELEKEIEKNDTVMRLSIPIKMRVAVTLRFLATNADYRTIGICLEYRRHQYV